MPERVSPSTPDFIQTCRMPPSQLNGQEALSRVQVIIREQFLRLSFPVEGFREPRKKGVVSKVQFLGLNLPLAAV